jgi:hypothetical protein
VFWLGRKVTPEPSKSTLEKKARALSRATQTWRNPYTATKRRRAVGVGQKVDAVHASVNSTWRLIANRDRREAVSRRSDFEPSVNPRQRSKRRRRPPQLGRLFSPEPKQQINIADGAF